MDWPYLTDPNLAISGRFKAEPEDFVVEEIPLYRPTANGEHLYLWIEKRNLSTEAVVRHLARQLGIGMKAIGYAGKKDRIGVTRQWISVQGVSTARVQTIDIPGVKILEAVHHRNKLRLGHLEGNRFMIRLRDVPESAEHIAGEVLKILADKGVPNYFGPQRFGNRTDNHLAGLAALFEDWETFFSIVLGSPRDEESPIIRQARDLYERGAYKQALQTWPTDQGFPRRALQALLEMHGDKARAAARLGRQSFRFYLHALQSFWFNQCLAKRITAIDDIWPGDLAYLHRNGAVFRVEHPAAELPRVKRFEISPSGPLFGLKMIEPEGKEKEIEDAVLNQTGLTKEQREQAFGKWRLEGQRRSYRIPIKDIQLQRESADLILAFTLPPGAYATVVLREIMKENFSAEQGELNSEETA